MKLTMYTATAVAALAVGIASVASANDGLLTMQENPAEWVMPNGNYSSTRYSTLAQINKDNVERPARSPGRSPPASCAATKAARWSSAT